MRAVYWSEIGLWFDVEVLAYEYARRPNKPMFSWQTCRSTGIPPSDIEVRVHVNAVAGKGPIWAWMDCFMVPNDKGYRVMKFEDIEAAGVPHKQVTKLRKTKHDKMEIPKCQRA
jgi:hypothetical protein